MIASAPNVGYIHEPFNVHHRPGVCAADFPFWFTYVTGENEAPYSAPLRDMLGFRYNVRAELRSLRSLRDMGRSVRDCCKFAGYRFRNSVPLVKDPIAVFSAEWLSSRLDMTVIIVLRHPAAFASSICRLHWTHRFSDFLCQPLLMRDHLQPFAAEISYFAEREQPLLDQAILLWRMIHCTILKFQELHPDWIFLRYEDISEDPLVGFEHLFDTLGLEFSAHAQSIIRSYSYASKRGRHSSSGAVDRRNSKATIRNWKNILTKDQIEYVQKGVEDISRSFYSDADW